MMAVFLFLPSKRIFDTIANIEHEFVTWQTHKTQIR